MEHPKRLEEGLAHETKDKNELFSEKVDKTNDRDVTNREKEDTSSVNQQKQQQQQPLVKQKAKRVATLDAFRGLTVAVSDINYK